MISQTQFDPKKYPGIALLLGQKGTRLFTRKLVMLLEQGGYGDMKLEFRNGELVRVQATSEGLTRNEPDEE